MAEAARLRSPSDPGHRWLTGLKGRMAFILAVVLVPALLYSFWQAFDAYRERSQQQAATVATMLRVIASYEADFLDQTRTLLQRLAAEPAIRVMERPACDQRLREARNRTFDYLDFVVLDSNGRGVCSSSPELLTAWGDRGYFRQLQAGSDFVVSGVLPRQRGRGETIVAAVPLHEPGSRRLRGAVAVEISLQSFERAIQSIEVPPQGVAYLVDSDGRPLMEPVAERTTTELRSLTPELFDTLTATPGREITELGGDGVRRDWFMANIAGHDVFVIVGIPSLPHLSWLQRELVIGIFAPTLMLALAVVTIWTASDYLVIRHVRTLAMAARAYSRGELGLRLSLASAPAEFQELARIMARMADRIQSREEELRASLQQKERLLREVHHRVKNNLQIVTSLLNLRAQRVQSSVARDAVRQAQMRIAALTLVHRSLYENDDIQEIELQDFLGDLCGMLEEVNAAEHGMVELVVTADPVRVMADQAIPMALLVTEAISNSFKHAFPNGQSGRIELRLVNAGQSACLTIVDDGLGLPSGEESSGGIGVTLMQMLAKQLNGRLTMAGALGTRLEVEFPLLQHGSYPRQKDAEGAATPVTL